MENSMTKILAVKRLDTTQSMDVTEDFSLPDYIPEVRRVVGVQSNASVDGKYLNQFHKESTERSLRYLEERKKRPIDLEREYRVHREISQMGRNKSEENPKTE
jgi:hypothetical protein